MILSMIITPDHNRKKWTDGVSLPVDESELDDRLIEILTHQHMQWKDREMALSQSIRH